MKNQISGFTPKKHGDTSHHIETLTKECLSVARPCAVALSAVSRIL
jgi:hypothetical protein